MNEEHEHIDEFVAYLAGELSVERQKKLEQQLEFDAALKASFDDFKAIWELSSTDVKAEPTQVATNQAWEKVRKRTSLGAEKPKSKVLSMSLFMRIAAILLVVFGIGYFMQNQAEKPLAHLAYSAGETARIVDLEDGSRITLSANSSVRLIEGFGEQHRKLTHQGEVRYEVQKNKALPFVINAGSAQVKVLGTVFTLSNWDSALVNLDVEEGLVQFAVLRNNEVQIDAILVKAGEEAVLQHGKVKQVTEADKRKALPSINFESAKLEHVAQVLTMKYGRLVQCSDDLSEQCEWSVKMRHASLPEVLDNLKNTYENLEIQQYDSLILIQGTACD